MDRERVVIGGRRLALVFMAWLRSTPDRLWGADANYEQLKSLKRHDPEQEPDPRREVADYIVARLEELEWEVTHPEIEQPTSPPSYNATPP